MDADFAGGCNQEEGKDHRLVISRTVYVITYANFLIIWASRIQTEIALSTAEVEYIDLSQEIRYVLPFVSFMKEIDFVLKLQGETPKVLCSLFKNPVTVYEDNQGEIALTLSLQM